MYSASLRPAHAARHLTLIAERLDRVHDLLATWGDPTPECPPEGAVLGWKLDQAHATVRCLSRRLATWPAPLIHTLAGAASASVLTVALLAAGYPVRHASLGLLLSGVLLA